MKQIFSAVVSSVVLIVYLAVNGFNFNDATQKEVAIKGTFKQVKTDTATFAGNWVLQPVLSSDTASGKIPTISFNLSKNKFSGFTGCNRMSGGFMAKGNKLAINQHLVLTKMHCEGYNEKEFITNLLRVTDYKIQDGVLQLMINKTPVSKWVRNSVNKMVTKL